MRELFDPMPYIEVLEESIHAQRITVTLVAALDGPAGTISATLVVTETDTAEVLWHETMTEWSISAGPNLVASAARRGLERAVRQLSPF